MLMVEDMLGRTVTRDMLKNSQIKVSAHLMNLGGRIIQNNMNHELQ